MSSEKERATRASRSMLSRGLKLVYPGFSPHLYTGGLHHSLRLYTSPPQLYV